MVQTAPTNALTGAFGAIEDFFHKLFHSFCEDPVTRRW
jgi:hypothetical protein